MGKIQVTGRMSDRPYSHLTLQGADKNFGLNMFCLKAYGDCWMDKKVQNQ